MFGRIIGDLNIKNMHRSTWRITQRKKKIRKLFQESYRQGNEYIQRKNEENKQKELFIYQSNCFFSRLSLLDFGQCNRLNCNDSTQICNILPQRFLNKVKMPKPIVVQGGIIYLPK